MDHQQKTKKDLAEEIVRLRRRVSELEHAKEALQNRESRFQALFENMSNAVAVYKADQDGEDFVLIDLNEAAEEIEQISRSEVIGKSVLEVFPSVREFGLFEVFKRVWRTGRAEHYPKDNRIEAWREHLVCRISPEEIVAIYGDEIEGKRAEETLEGRTIALTRPLDEAEAIAFEDLFNLEEIQKLQDQFAKAVGVGSLITRPDGTPITKPSNFCRLCDDIIRKTEKGLMNCQISDSTIGGGYHPDGPNIQTCLSAGLGNAGTSITVGGRHIANWLIGQVRNEMQDPDAIQAYARMIGGDEEAFMEAYHEVPYMSQEQFADVAQALFTLGGQLSTMAYQNVQQGRFIAERKQAEESLRVERERFQMLSDRAPFGMVMIAEDGTFEYVNPKFTEIFGYDLSDVPNRKSWRRKAFPDPTYRHEVDSTWKEELERLPSTATRSRVLSVACKDGTKKIVHFRTVRLGAGEDLMTCEDITDRMRTEEALQIRERALASSISGLAIADFAGTITYVNPPALRLCGYEEESEVLGKRAAEFFVMDERAREGWKITAKTGSWVGELTVRRKDGSSFEALVVATVVRNYEGMPMAIMGSFLDITDRKRAQQALRESEEKYRALFEESLDAVFITTRDGRLVDANQAFLDLFSFTREEARDMDILKIYIDAADRERLQEELEEKGNVKDYEIRHRKKDGRQIECLLTSKVRRDSDGTILGYQGIIRDVTDRRQLQRQLLQAQKMEAIGTLAGGIAHDFNNILQVVLGYSDVLLFRKTAADPEYVALHAIRRAGRDGSELAKRLLAFGRKLEPNARPLNLNNEISRVQKMLERTVPRMIRIDLNLADDLMTVNADPGQMEQILLNLAVNAQHAMPDGGRLIIETANITLNEDYSRTHLDVEPGKYVLLMVSDTGCGMEEEVMEHIFEPFYTTKGPGEGTGLGLAMVFGIVKSHKGHVTCYSEPGTGTTFKIYLPAIVQEIEQDVDVTRQMPAFGTETILLVDDEESVRKLGEEMLEMAGYSVLTADNGREALEVYRSSKSSIALVLLDLIMPEMGGKQCLDEILKINPRVKVVIASGYSANGPTKEQSVTGAKGFVSKPFSLGQLLQTVRKILDEA